MMKAGFYETDITPPLGTERPATFDKRLIQTIHDPLKSRAVVITDGTEKIALVGVDSIGTGPGFRRLVEEALPEFKVILNFSHTHYGGNLKDPLPGIEEAPEEIKQYALVDSVAHDSVYYNFCLKQVITSIRMADSRLEEVEFSFNKGRVENLIFNRRIRMKDGHVQTHPGKGNPDNVDFAGPVDDQVGVVGVWKKGTKEMLGFLLNFSCHACIRLDGATADFPGVAVETVRKVFGAHVGAVYVNGASGDVTQINNLSLKRDTGGDIADKLGMVLGGEAVKLLADSDRGEVNTLRYMFREIVPGRQKVDPAVVEEARERARNNDGSSQFKMAKTIAIQAYVDQVVGDKAAKEKLAVLQLGPLVVCSSSGEMFAQFALDLKAASAFPYTWYAQLNGGPLGYVPTKDCFEKTGGGYETATSLFVAETGYTILDNLEEMVKTLTPEEEPAPDLVEVQNQVWDFNFEKKKK
jgi:hypothetical protein